MGYVIAAYTVVVGSLVGYGLWVVMERRALMRGAARAEDDPPTE